MILKNISIINYKNIKSANMELSPKINCLIGHNGMGKTNFLDAIYYLSFCRSASNPIDSQIITHDEAFFMLEGNYENDNGDSENIYCGMKRGTKKHFKRNKKEYKRLSQHIGLIPLIFVSPSDVSLIEGGSEERRKLMDVVISQYDHTYIEYLSNYNKALQQRNALLKMETEPDATLMELWEQQMSGDKEQVGLHYISHCQRGPLLEVIQRDRFKDRAVGYSLHGVHRDDLEFTIGDYQMKREGSQGQNKSFVIALKLAQFSFLMPSVLRQSCNWFRVIASVRYSSRIPIVIISTRFFIVWMATTRFSQ